MYEGYLLKVRDNEITGDKYIEIDSYDAALNVQDIDSYRDGNGELHRNALSHTPISIDFNLRSGLNNNEVEAFMNLFKPYINDNERKVRMKAFVPELNDYVEQDMYMATPKFKIKKVTKSAVYYGSTQISFVGY